MGFFDFLQRPGVDPALEEQLKKRGMTDKLQELQNNRPASLTSQFFKELIPSTAKVGSPVTNFTGGNKLAQGLAGNIVAPQVNSIEQQNFQAKSDLLQGIRDEAKRGELTTERRTRLLKMADQIGVGDVAKEIPELQLSNKAVLADAGQLSLTALLALKPSLGGLPNTTGKLISSEVPKVMEGLNAFNKTVQVEERIRRYGPTAGKLLNYGVNTAKQIAVDAPIGAGLFGLQAAGEDKSNKDVAKQAGIGAAITATAPIALGAAIRSVTGAGGLLYRKVIGPAGDALISKLEKVAAGSVPKISEATDEVSKTLAVYPKRFVTATQAAADKTLGFIKAVQDLPAKFTDRFAVIAKKFGYESYRDARLASPTAEGKAEMALGDLFGTKSKPGALTQFADIEDAVKARITKLDFLARATDGQKVASGETVPQLEAGLQKLTQEAGTNEPRVQQALKVWNDFHLKMLNERVDAGLISPEARDAMLKKYPNYMPHDVIMGLDEGIGSHMDSGSLNVSKTDIYKAVGSERQLEDPFVAVAGRLPNTYGVIEKNKVINTMVQAQEKSGGTLVEGMRPIQTAAQVTERRKAFTELTALKQELFNIRESLTVEGGANKTINNRILQAEKTIEELYNKGMNSRVVKEDIQLFNQLKQEVEQARSVALGKHLRGPLQKTEAINLGQINEATFGNIKKLIQDHPLIDDKTKAKLIADFEKGLAHGGKITIPENMVGSKAGKDLRELVSDNRAEKVDQLMAKYHAGKLKSEGTPGERVTSAFGLNRPILEQKFKVFKGEEAAADSGKKLNQAIATLKEKQSQIGKTLQDIKETKAGTVGLGEQTINFFRNGIKETWVVPNDVAVAVKNLDAEKMSTVMKALTAPTRLLKSFATRYNLSFVLPNKLRDKQTALLTADAFIEDMLAKTGGTFPGSGPVNLAKDDLYRIWKEAGGGFGSIFREGKSVNMQTLGKLKQQGIWKNLGELRPDKAIDHLNQTIEESTRLAVFEKALNRGLSIKDAALVSRDATVDFSKMGTWMRNLNEIVPFLNARVQGAINIGRAAKLAPETFARMQMWSAVYPTLALHQWNSQFASSKNIPQYFYDNYWVIQTGETEGFDNNGKQITIPKFITLRKGEGQALVANPIQYFLRHADGSDPRRVGQMIQNTIGSLSPVDFGSGVGQKNIFLSFASQFGPLGNIAIGLGTNIDPYSGQQIIPDSRKDASKAMQFKTTTPQIVREAAKVMGVSPANLDFVLNSFGGVPGDVISVLNLGEGAIKGQGLRTNPLEESKFGQATQLPVTKRFFRESTGYGSAIDIKNRELKSELQAEVTDKSLKIKDEAQKYLQEMNKFKTKNERIKYLEQINPSDEVRKKMSQLKKSHQAAEVLTTQDSVELRAKYIWQRVAEMKQAGVDVKDRTKFLDDLEQAKILTPDVKKNILQLKQQ